MIDIKLKYEAVIFLNASQIVPDTKNIAKFIELFEERELIPSVFQEITPPNPPVSRLRLSSQNNEYAIMFGVNRISIQKSPTDDNGNNLGEVSDFCDEVSTIYEKINKLFPRKATRLAVVSHYLLRNFSESKMDDIYRKFLNPFSFYKENLPVEWNTMTVSRLRKNWENFDEDVNLVTKINRIKGQIENLKGLAEIDRIQIEIDYNTLPENNEERFDLDKIKSFYKYSTEDVCVVLNDVLEAIGE